VKLRVARPGEEVSKLEVAEPSSEPWVLISLLARVRSVGYCTFRAKFSRLVEFSSAQTTTEATAPAWLETL